MSLESCRLTVTSLKAQRALFLDQIRATMLTCRGIMSKLIASKQREKGHQEDLRKCIVAIRSDGEAYNLFFNVLMRQHASIPVVIERLASTTVNLLKIHISFSVQFLKTESIHSRVSSRDRSTGF